MSVERIYCPTCSEYAIDTGRSKCAWCGDELKAVTPKRTYKRRTDAKLTERQVRMAYEAYMAGNSLRAIAGRIWEQAGYASLRCCANGLHVAFQRHGYPLRDRLAATVKASTTHGMASRGNKAAYKRWRRRQRGLRPKCKGVRLQYPRKGEPCGLQSMVDSDFCRYHDPSRREVVLASVAAARQAIAA